MGAWPPFSLRRLRGFLTSHRSGREGKEQRHESHPFISSRRSRHLPLPALQEIRHRKPQQITTQPTRPASRPNQSQLCKKNDKIPDFSFDDLLASMKQGADHASGKITARTHQLTKRAEVFSSEEIAGIRKQMNVSQSVFADLLNVPKATAISWERGLRSPSGAAIRLLQIAKNRPQALLETASHA